MCTIKPNSGLWDMMLWGGGGQERSRVEGEEERREERKEDRYVMGRQG